MRFIKLDVPVTEYVRDGELMTVYQKLLINVDHIVSVYTPPNQELGVTKVTLSIPPKRDGSKTDLPHQFYIKGTTEDLFNHIRQNSIEV